jgi:hypothetical protein
LPFFYICARRGIHLRAPGRYGGPRQRRRRDANLTIRNALARPCQIDYLYSHLIDFPTYILCVIPLIIHNMWCSINATFHCTPA